MADKAKNPLSYAKDYWKSGRIKSDLEEPAKEGRAIGEKMKMAQQALNPPATDRAPAKSTETYPSDRVNPNYKYGDKPGEKRIDTTEMTKPLGSFKDGGTVPKTGVYKLHKGEHVVTPQDHGKMMHHMALASSVLAHDEPPKDAEPKKEVHELHIKKGANGGFIVKHIHKMPHLHPDEEHVASHMDEMHDHLEEHMGEPDEGEEEMESPGTQAAEQALGYK